jgi:4-oxalocrotonate tautomerase
MPHVVVKMYAGKSEEQKARIAQEIAQALMTSGGYAEKSVSVSIEDVAPSDWVERVYKPDIMSRWDSLYKKPGYNPL